MSWPVLSLTDAHALMTQPGTAFELEERVVHGVPMRVWKNGPKTLRDVFIAGRDHGDKTYLVYEDHDRRISERATFEGFARATLALAEALTADGVVKGDRVVIAMRNLPEWPAAFFAAQVIGAIAVPLNAWWTGPELQYALVDSGAKVAIVDAERLERIDTALKDCPDLQRVYVSRSDGTASDPLLRNVEDIIGAVNEWSTLPVCDMKIMGDDGVELPRGQVGELWGKGPNVVRAYWRKPQATAETFVDGWVRTGDLATMDGEGFLYIVDRKKDMLIRGGENIYCVEMEDALFAHPAVMDAGVIGLPHRTLGEEPAAVVTIKPGQQATEDELRDFVRAKLAAFKVPVRIVMLNETLPRNANGKIMKKELRPLFGEAA